MIAFLLATLLQAETPSIHDVLDKHRDRLHAIEGVVGVTAGGSSESPILVVRVRDGSVLEAVKKAVGPAVDGIKTFVYPAPGSTVSGDPPAKPPTTAPPPTEPGKPAEVKDPIEDCDIIRDHRKLKEIKHTENGKTYPNCALMNRQVIGSGGGHAFWYTRHRWNCPVRKGEVAPAAGQDGFTRWVLNLGFYPAVRGSFLYPTELKGSDTLWFRQVHKDLTEVLPYIRDGAVWTEQPSPDGYGWAWKAPRRVAVPADPVPTK
jgi:hypothetical protein